LKNAALVALFAVLGGWGGGCAPPAAAENPARIAALEQTYAELHARLEKAAGKDPVISSAFAEPGQVIVAFRAGLIEQLAGDVARHYLDTVTVDLKNVKGNSSGEIHKDTFLGDFKVGEWKVNVRLGKLQGRLRVGQPRLALKHPNLIEIRLPVDVSESEGDARLSFSWDSSSIANVLCKDFELDREIRGRVIPQSHLLEGAMRLENIGEGLIAAPVFPDRHVQLKLDLTPASWGIVEEAIRSQNHSGKCGTLLKPDRTLGFLRELAGNGIRIRLPDSIFRTVKLPGRFHQYVEVDEHKVALAIKAETLRVDTRMLWSSASIQVQPGNQP
jgi:hypothetical protein